MRLLFLTILLKEGSHTTDQLYFLSIPVEVGMRFFLVALSLFVQFGLLDHTVPIIGYHAFRASAYFYQLEFPLPQPSASDPPTPNFR